MPPPVNIPWDGPPKIVIGIDLGTTCSAVSYSYLYPGGPRLITSVSQWPDQRYQAGETKIPTLIWYDKHKKPVKRGASALTANAMETKENGWQLAKHFKLHLHPETMKSRHQLRPLGLPGGIFLEQVYPDYMAYLLKHTRQFFQERVLDGAIVWKHYFNSADIIITHPNGWGGREQAFLRKAAIEAGFPDPEQTTARIRFVTEAEASVHFCMFKADLGSDWPQEGVQFAVCDAGGSTVDITTYEVTKTRPTLQLREIKPSACIQAGAIFVDDLAKKHIRRLLSDPDWITRAKFDDEDVEDSIRRGLENFEIEKKSFGLKAELKLEAVSSRLGYDAKELRIRRGELVLNQGTLSSFFDPCIDQIVAALRTQIAGLNVENILLVGGFGESPYLRQKLIHEMANQNRRITIANDLTSKAVADGAVLWSTQASVDGRASRFSFGTIVAQTYDPDDPEHKDRTVYRDVDGENVVWGAWSEILPKGQVVSATHTFTEEYCMIYGPSGPALKTFTETLYAFTPSDRAAPRFLLDREDPHTPVTMREGFASVCELSADLSVMGRALEKKQGPTGDYWKLTFNIGIQFGGVELQAFVEWIEKGVKRRSEVSIVPTDIRP